MVKNKVNLAYIVLLYWGIDYHRSRRGSFRVFPRCTLFTKICIKSLPNCIKTNNSIFVIRKGRTFISAVDRSGMGGCQPRWSKLSPGETAAMELHDYSLFFSVFTTHCFLQPTFSIRVNDDVWDEVFSRKKNRCHTKRLSTDYEWAACECSISRIFHFQNLLFILHPTF